MNVADISQTETDKSLGWANPYVCVSFVCRICNAEQSYNEDEWLKHFNSHIINPPQVSQYCYKIIPSIILELFFSGLFLLLYGEILTLKYNIKA